MNVIRAGREALREMMPKPSARRRRRNGNLARRESARIADLARGGASLGAGLFRRSAVGRELPATEEWYVRMKSRPSFRSLLADRVPGQPPVTQYAELDF